MPGFDNRVVNRDNGTPFEKTDIKMEKRKDVSLNDAHKKSESERTPSRNEKGDNEHDKNKEWRELDGPSIDRSELQKENQTHDKFFGTTRQHDRSEHEHDRER